MPDKEEICKISQPPPCRTHAAHPQPFALARVCSLRLAPCGVQVIHNQDGSTTVTDLTTIDVSTPEKHPPVLSEETANMHTASSSKHQYHTLHTCTVGGEKQRKSSVRRPVMRAGLSKVFLSVHLVCAWVPCSCPGGCLTQEGWAHIVLLDNGSSSSPVTLPDPYQAFDSARIQVDALLSEAMNKRTVGCTALNEQSSRSHMVFSLKIDGTNSSTGDA
eukprot:1146184-Pelagomonas_calceolata.AAC.3